MDKSKDANILVNAVLLEKLEFNRKPVISRSLMAESEPGKDDIMNLQIDSRISRSLNADKTKLIVKFQMLVEDKEQTIKALCGMVGIFSQIKEGSVNLEEYSKIHAPSLLFPYIRENISNVTMKAGMSPIVLPPMNLVKLISESKEIEEHSYVEKIVDNPPAQITKKQ
jgi:preprotein translocase subunit SecB